ncbi:hypothetical protein B0F90DRAFT_1665830 [Multifurca ochricompacta]|uniref:Uncharacterized protein n=1 Tax=Multifurca ochricompacta TaxID=376703 RepID=A0AAD4MCC4_9AGAM|nr:hypothetical protein B0F90DRAFT_1665830 [Multifurca ochricompacta]
MTWRHRSSGRWHYTGQNTPRRLHVVSEGELLNDPKCRQEVNILWERRRQKLVQMRWVHVTMCANGALLGESKIGGRLSEVWMEGPASSSRSSSRKGFASGSRGIRSWKASFHIGIVNLRLRARNPHVDRRKRGTSYDEHLNGTKTDTFSIRDEYGKKKWHICSPRKSVEIIMLRETFAGEGGVRLVFGPRPDGENISNLFTSRQEGFLAQTYFADPELSKERSLSNFAISASSSNEVLTLDKKAGDVMVKIQLGA